MKSLFIGTALLLAFSQSVFAADEQKNEAAIVCPSNINELQLKQLTKGPIEFNGKNFKLNPSSRESVKRFLERYTRDYYLALTDQNGEEPKYKHEAQRCTYKAVWIQGDRDVDDLPFEKVRELAVQGDPIEISFTLINYKNNQ